ncbi:MAG: restriction endonuclease subunit S [Desulfamplus sp.]|nr:restriction endonuclease subunit S [Desulfamplus sp.]
MEIRAGYKKTEVGLIPDDWIAKSFRDICWVNQGLQISISQRLSLPNKSSKIYITIQYLNDGKAIEYIDDYLPSVCCNKDDILMTRTGNTGIVVYGVEGVFHNNFFKINFDKDKVDKKYLIYYLNLSKIQKIILAKAGTSTIPDLNHNDFYSIPIILPPTLTEQTAIANALSDADALITSLEKLIAKKRNIKQGAMQKLLQPKEDWEVKRLGEVAEIVGGGTPSTFNDAFWHGQINWFTPTEIMTEGCTNQGFQSLIVKNNYYNEFLYYLIQTKKNLLLQNASGSTFLEITPNKLKQIEVAVPSFQEQTCIATILSDMDNEITALENKLEKYKKIKLGMMQNLLTGRIRLI